MTTERGKLHPELEAKIKEIGESTGTAFLYPPDVARAAARAAFEHACELVCSADGLTNDEHVRSFWDGEMVPIKIDRAGEPVRCGTWITRAQYLVSRSPR